MTDQYWSPAKQDPAAIPFRNKFDGARDPLTARNAIGAVDTAFVADAIATAGAGYQPAGNYALTADFPADAWTTWSPTITAGAGTLTSASVTTARYTTAGKTVTAYFDISIANQGTGSGFLQITLPIAMNALSGGSAIGVEIGLTGSAVVGRLEGATSTTIAFLHAYDGSTMIVTGVRIMGTMVYESA